MTKKIKKRFSLGGAERFYLRSTMEMPEKDRPVIFLRAMTDAQANEHQKRLLELEAELTVESSKALGAFERATDAFEAHSEEGEPGDEAIEVFTEARLAHQLTEKKLRERLVAAKMQPALEYIEKIDGFWWDDEVELDWKDDATFEAAGITRIDFLTRLGGADERTLNLSRLLDRITKGLEREAGNG